MWALKVDINLLNQHCKSADWLADWLTDWLSHLGTQGTQGNRTLKHLRHSGTPGTRRAHGHSGYLGTWGTRRAIGHSCTQGTWALEGHLGTWAIKALGNLGTQGLGHLGTQGTLFSRLLNSGLYKNLVRVWNSKLLHTQLDLALAQKIYFICNKSEKKLEIISKILLNSNCFYQWK